jgi:uncharacterized protein (UPF0332 family)
MSPRSEEFMASAHEWLASARHALQAGFTSPATSAAYFAMLYAARAALSEKDLNAKTHRGIWNLFRETFVETARFDAELHRDARKTQPVREATDYDAAKVTAEEARRVVELADRFVAAVDGLLRA